MIYKIGAKVKFKIGTGFKWGVIIGRNIIAQPDFPYHVRSEDNNEYWISKDSIVVEEPKPKYKVGDRINFMHFGEGEGHIGTIINIFKNDPDKRPYLVNCGGAHYAVKEDEILYRYGNNKGTDYTSFYYGRRPGKSVKPKWDSLHDECPLYSKKDVEVLQKLYSRIMCTGAYLPKIKKVIFNDPATIVFWEDGTKTVVKAQTSVTGQAFADGQHLIDLTKTDLFDPEKGLAMAIAKKALGNDGNYYNEFKKWLPKEEKNGKKNRR